MSRSVGLGNGNTPTSPAAANMRMIQAIAAQNSGPSRRVRLTGLTATSWSMPSSSVAMADPRVEDGVEHVDNEVHDHEACGDQQHHALQDDQGTGIARADKKPGDSRQSKDRFDDHRAADQSPDVDSGYRDERQRRRFQGVHKKDARRFQPLG